MKTKITFLTLFFALFSVSALAQSKGTEVFVSQEWLLEHKADDNLVILHVANPNSYKEGHIEGAVTINPPEYTVVRGDLYWELPEVSKMDSTLRSKGINNDSHIILYYGGDDHAATFRLYFTLDYFGLSDKVRILDGGLKGWKANNKSLTTQVREVVASPQGSLKLKPRKKIKVDKKYVKKSASKDKINVIDARRDTYYSGAQQGDYKRGGHIAGAGNICWLDVVDENMFIKDKAQLAQMYAAQGVAEGEQVVAYCHVGLRASTIYTLAKYLGFEARLYDGSFNEWHALPDEYGVEKSN